MSETTTEAAATGTEGAEQTAEQTKPTETVDFWKQKAREQEKRAKENATAAQRLAEIEDAQKSEQEKAAERVAKAEAEVATIPAKVADALRSHLVALHEIDKDKAELFLTATDPELLLRQVNGLLEESGKRKTNGNHVPREGEIPKTGDDPMRELVRGLFKPGE